MNLLVKTAGVQYDLSRYIDPSQKPQKTDSANGVKLLDFSLVSYQEIQGKIGAGSYITVTTNAYGVWYTGYITTDPEYVHFAGRNWWTLKFHATSEEVILNKHAVGTRPPFINETQGSIIRKLVKALSPVTLNFDVTGVQDGILIPRYVVDPNQHFTEIVQTFCKAANYRFEILNHRVTFSPLDSTALTITVDGSSKHFTPKRLQLKPMSDGITNQAIVLGNIEPQGYVNEYFVGDGITAKYPLIASVFGSDSSVLLDDPFTGSTIDSSKWTIFDPSGQVLTPFGGTINVVGGAMNHTYEVCLQSANLIPIEGTLRLTHGEFDFVANTRAVIGGLYLGARSPSACLYGMYAITIRKDTSLEVEPNFTGAPTTTALMPIIRGGPDGSRSFRIDYTKRYIFRTIMQTDRTILQHGDSSYVDGQGVVTHLVGGSDNGKATFTTWITEVNPLTGEVTNLFEWIDRDVPLYSGQVGATYAPILSDYSNLTFTSVTISVPIQASLQHRPKGTNTFSPTLIGPNELNSYDGLAPVATIVDSNSGAVSRNSTLGTKNFNPGHASLQYFSDDPVAIPSSTLAALNPNLSAVPNPIRIPFGTNTGSTIITWGNGPTVSQIWKSAITTGGGGTLITTGGTSGSINVTNVASGSLYYLVNGSTGTAVDSLVIQTQTMYIPSAGDLIWLRYREAGVAIGVAEDRTSIASEAAAWLDDGVRAQTIMGTKPSPRTSYECEMIATAIVQGSKYQHYNGQYQMSSGEWFGGEPKAGTIMRFQNLPSIFPSYLKAETVTQVVSTIEHSGGTEVFDHVITFGPIDLQSAALATLRSTNDVFAPQDTAEIPLAIDVTALGKTTVPDVVDLQLDSWDSAYYYLKVGAGLIKNGSFEKTALFDWQYGIASGGGLTLMNDPAVAHSGTRCVRLSGNTTVVFQDLVATPSVTYTISGWAKTEVAGTNVGSIVVHQIDGVLSPVSTAVSFPGVGYWQQFKLSFTANATGKMRVHFYCNLTSGNIFYDDVFVTSDANNFLLSGGGYEVRYSDGGWGSDDGKNLLARSFSETFQIPRTNRGKVVYIRAFDVRNQVLWSEDITKWSPSAGTSFHKQVGKNPNGDSIVLVGLTPSLSGDSSVGQFLPHVAPKAGETWIFSVSFFGIAGTNVAINLVTDHESKQSPDLTLTGQSWQRLRLVYTFTQNATWGMGASIIVRSLGFAQITEIQIEKATTGTETIYCKTAGLPYGVLSRYHAAAHLALPLIPPAPTAVVDMTNPTKPVLNVSLPLILQDVWGIQVNDGANTKVIYRKDLIDSGYSPSITMPTNAGRSVSYAVYTYNVLGEYSTQFAVTGTKNTPVITATSINETTGILTVRSQYATRLRIQTQQPPNADPAANIVNTVDLVVSTPNVATDTQWTISTKNFTSISWFYVTPYDDLGAGNVQQVTHSHTPGAPVSFGPAEVYVIAPPTSPTNVPTVPSQFTPYATTITDTARNNYLNNLDVRDN